MKKQLALVFCLGWFIGCSSEEKKKQPQKPSVSADQSLDESLNGESERSKPPVKRDEAEEIYEKLDKAIKASMDTEVVRLASSLLERNQKDIKVLNALAMYHYQKKRYGLARIVLGRAFNVKKNDATLYSNLGLIDLAEGDQSAAIRSFRSALRSQPNHPHASANLGAIYVRNGDYRKGRLVLEAAVKKFDEDYRVLHNYGLALSESGQPKKALDSFEEAVELNNSDSNLLLNYAILLIEKIGDYEKGMQILDRLRFSGITPEVRARVELLEKKARENRK